MKNKNAFTDRSRMQRLVRSGREAIEKRLLRAIVLPIDRGSNDAEVDEIRTLLRKYNEVMAVYEAPKALQAPISPQLNRQMTLIIGNKEKN